MSLPGKKIPAQQASELREYYRAVLFDDVVPWWMRNSLDREYGGYYSLLGRDGRPWATDKYMWMNGRQVWLLSHLYNVHQQNPDWLEAAKLGAEFMVQNAKDLERSVHVIPRKLDQEIARLKLKAMNVEIDDLTAEQEAYLNSWEEGT